MSRFLSVIFSWFVLLCIFVGITHPTFAAEQFDVGISNDYVVSENGVTRVSEHVKITNNEDFIYAPTYTINSGLDDISNITVTNTAGSIAYEVEKSKVGQDITITFPDRVVGKGRSNEFTLAFDTKKIAQKKGTVWEIDIPGLADPDSYGAYSATVSIPETFGPPAVTKPLLENATGSKFRFTKDQVGTSGIFMAFGEAQYYSLNLVYHLENPNLFPIRTEIALPPNTSYQTVLINSISPKPLNVYSDKDGNWLAEYELSPQGTIKIDVSGVTQIRSIPEESEAPQNNTYVVARDFWDVGNRQIQESASKKTPQEIYEYVVEKLSYNYDKVGAKNERLGASRALSRPDFAVCLEFTDLFVAMARAAGIPARAVEGYAYTDNSKTRPLSLSEDSLHAWPEYYDTARSAWIMVDPTWGDTTGGIDYFNSLDFDHIAFVMKGVSSTYPIPAGGYKTDNPGRDLTIRFADKSLYNPKTSVELSHTIPEDALPGLPIRASVIIKNSGNSAVPANTLKIATARGVEEYSIEAIPPFGSKTVEIASFSLPFLTSEPQSRTISYNGATIKAVTASSFVPQNIVIIIGGIFICVGIIVLIIAIRAWRLHLQK